MTFPPGRKPSQWHVILAFLGASLVPGAPGQEPGGHERGAKTEFKKSQAGISALVVTESGDGLAGRVFLIGQVSRLVLTASPMAADGGRRVPAEFQVNQSAGEALQGSLKNVRQYFTASRGQWPAGYLLELGFEQAGRAQDGASTGLAVALLLDALVSGRELDPELCVTGAVTPEGNITPVAGVIPKIEAARQAGKWGVIIPTGNERAMADMLLLEGPKALYQIQVLGMGRAEDATRFAYMDRDESVTSAMKDFDRVAGFLRAREHDPSKFKESVNNPRVAEVLTRILQVLPEHLSAKTLSQYIKGECPGRLSLPTSLRGVERVYMEIKHAAETNACDELSVSINRLEELKRILNERSINYAIAVAEYGMLWHEMLSAARGGEQDALRAKIPAAARRIGTELEYLKAPAEPIGRDRGIGK